MNQPVQRGIRTFDMIQREEMQKSMASGSQQNQSVVVGRYVGQPVSQPQSLRGNPLLPGQQTASKTVQMSPISAQPQKQNPLMMVSRYQPQNSFMSDQSVPISVPQSIASRPTDQNQSLNDYFADYQRKQMAQSRLVHSNNPHPHIHVNHSQFGPNPLKINVSEKLVANQSILSDQQSFNQFLPPNDTSNSNRTVHKQIFQPETNPRINRANVMISGHDPQVNTSFANDQRLVQTLTPQAVKVSNDFTELSSKTNNKLDESHREQRPVAPAKVPTAFGRLDLKDTSALKQNKYDLIVSRDKFINESFKKDFDVSLFDMPRLPQKEETAKAKPALPTPTPQKEINKYREQVPENPYKRENSSILGALDKDSLNQSKSLEISLNYGYIAPKAAQEAAKKGQLLQSSRVENDRQKGFKKHKIHESSKKNTPLSQKPQETVINTTRSEQGRLVVENSDSIGDIVKGIATLILRILEILYAGCSELIDKLIKDPQASARNNSAIVALKLPLSIKTTMDANSYENMKKAIVIIGGFLLYRHMFK